MQLSVHTCIEDEAIEEEKKYKCEFDFVIVPCKKNNYNKSELNSRIYGTMKMSLNLFKNQISHVHWLHFIV